MSIIVGGEARSKKGVVEEKEKRATLRMRKAMDFHPKLRVVHGQKEVGEYLALFGVRLPSKIEVEWCSPVIDVSVSPPAGGVYFHPRILALG